RTLSRPVQRDSLFLQSPRIQRFRIARSLGIRPFAHARAGRAGRGAHLGARFDAVSLLLHLAQLLVLGAGGPGSGGTGAGSDVARRPRRGPGRYGEGALSSARAGEERALSALGAIAVPPPCGGVVGPGAVAGGPARR